jgi:hypothetical protein
MSEAIQNIATEILAIAERLEREAFRDRQYETLARGLRTSAKILVKVAKGETWVPPNIIHFDARRGPPPGAG